MSLSEVNWTTHLGGTSRLTPDITFRVVLEEDEDEGETLQQDEPKVVGTPMKTRKKINVRIKCYVCGQRGHRKGDTICPGKKVDEGDAEVELSATRDIKAHKFLLASVSDVFESMFFGDMKEKREVIELKETTMVAARALFNYIYEKPDSVKIEAMSMKNIFHLYKLADRYRITSLMETVEEVIKNKELTKENVMEVAAMAEKYLIVFEDISKDLQKRCGNFVRASMNISPDVKEFLKNEELDLDLFRKLVIQAEDVPAPMCNYCVRQHRRFQGGIPLIQPLQDMGTYWHCPRCGQNQAKLI